MKQAAIFLDFDGPLVNRRTRAAGGQVDLVAAQVIANAARDLRHAGVNVSLVVSSSWRASGRDYSKTLLRDGTAFVRGTPLWFYVADDWCIEGPEWQAEGGSPGARARNIQEWARGHGVEPDAMLVVDDYDLRPFLSPLVTQAKADEPEGLSSTELARVAGWVRYVAGAPRAIFP